MSVPKWPDFALRRMNNGVSDYWMVRTDTGRPKTPIFSLILRSSWDMRRDEAEQAARVELDARFKKAHPNGCPGTRS